MDKLTTTNGQDTDLVRSIAGALALSEKYTGMLETLSSGLPATRIASEVYNKSASQLKTVTLDITDHTPIATAKHVLARITRKRQALEEASVGVERKKLDIRRKQHQIDTMLNEQGEPLSEFDVQALQLDLIELRNQVENTEAYARGAIRETSFLIKQYDAIMERLGVDTVTEDMHEEDQARAHVKTAFFQALTAARARGGVVDEGNMIYFFHLGINGGVAQRRILDFLNEENALLGAGKEPSHEMVVAFLENMADLYQDHPRKYAELRGLIPKDEQSLVDPNALLRSHNE